MSNQLTDFLSLPYGELEDLNLQAKEQRAKRTPIDAYPVQGRGGRGGVTAKIVEARGELGGALMVRPTDEIFAITSAGGVIRTSAGEVKQSGRQTRGVRLMNLAAGDSVVGLARNAESIAEAEAEAADTEAGAIGAADPADPDSAAEEEGEA